MIQLVNASAIAGYGQSKPAALGNVAPLGNGLPKALTAFEADKSNPYGSRLDILQGRENMVQNTICASKPIQSKTARWQEEQS
jgi:hypothetical protein